MVTVETKENVNNRESNIQHMEVALGANHLVHSPLRMIQNNLPSGDDSDDEEDRKETPEEKRERHSREAEDNDDDYEYDYSDKLNQPVTPAAVLPRSPSTIIYSQLTPSNTVVLPATDKKAEKRKQLLGAKARGKVDPDVVQLSANIWDTIPSKKIEAVIAALHGYRPAHVRSFISISIKCIQQSDGFCRGSKRH